MFCKISHFIQIRLYFAPTLTGTSLRDAEKIINDDFHRPDHPNYHSLVPSSAHSSSLGIFLEPAAPPLLYMDNLSYKHVSPLTHFKTLFSLRLRRLPIPFIPLSLPDPLIVIVNAYCVIERAYLNWLLCYRPLFDKLLLSCPSSDRREALLGITSSRDSITFWGGGVGCRQVSAPDTPAVVLIP